MSFAPYRVQHRAEKSELKEESKAVERENERRKNEREKK
jgi:hypothetical protein